MTKIVSLRNGTTIEIIEIASSDVPEVVEPVDGIPSSDVHEVVEPIETETTTEELDDNAI